MAKRNVIAPGGAALPHPGDPADRAIEGVNPTGYLCENWFSSAPALRVNADASQAALVAWCCAEVQALQAAAHTFNMALQHDAQAVCSNDTFAKLFLHRLGPLESMLETLAGDLAKEERDQAH